MATAWSDVIQSKEYQSLPTADQQAAQQQYFTQVVANKPEFQSLPESDKQAAATQFFGKSTPLNVNNPVESISSEGMGYVLKHPVASVIQGLPQTITGKTLANTVIDNSPKTPMTPDQINSYKQNWNTNPTSFNELNVGDRLKAAGAGAVDLATAPVNAVIPVAGKALGVAGEAIGNATNNIGKFLNFDQKALTLGAKVRQVAAASKQAAVDKFGASVDAQAIANPTESVSLENVINDIKTNFNDMPVEAQSVFRKVPILKDMLKDPGTEGYIDPSNVSLKNTQGIINYINTKIPRSIKSSSLDVLDAQNDIRAAQLDAFPDMAQTRADYGKFAEDYKLVKSALNPKSTPGAIMSNFNNNIAVKDAASRVLSPVVKEMSKLRTQKSIVEWVKKLGIAGAGLEGAQIGYKAITTK